MEAPASHFMAKAVVQASLKISKEVLECPKESNALLDVATLQVIALA